MAHECFDVETTGRVAHLRMIRPERSNSMIPSFWRELPEIVDKLSASGTVRALVLSSEGRHFCSGMDLAVFAGNDTLGAEGGPGAHRSRRNEAFRSMALRLQDSFTALERARMPVLCAIQGACVGSALELAAVAGRVVARPNAWFHLPEMAMGILPGAGGCVTVSRRIGRQRAALMILSGRRIDVRTALRWGLVDAVEDD